MEQVKCTQCNGYYKIREGKYGFFGGCSNFPRCKSTLKMPDMLAQFFNINGVNIYGWDRVCRNCKKTSKVYTYYLDYEIAKICEKTFYDVIFLDSVGLGDIPYIDDILMKKYPTIQLKFRNNAKKNSIVNTCQYCGLHQNKNDVIVGKHEIVEVYDCSMEEYLVDTINIESIDKFKEEIKPLIRDPARNTRKKVKCLCCNGYYKVYNYNSIQCSNYPICKSTLEHYDFVTRFFQINGVNIYAWDRICGNCGKHTRVYSYYLDYELEQGFPEQLVFINLDLGTIPYLDNILEKKYSTINMLPGPDNICKHCGEEQDIAVEFGEPREIIADLCFGHMEKYLVETLEIEPTDEFIKQIKSYF